MKVRIKDITDSGFPLVKSLEKSGVDGIISDTGHRAGGDLQFDSEIYMAGDRIVVNGRINVPLLLNCVRCLCTVEANINEKFRIVLFPAKEMEQDFSSKETCSDDPEKSSTGSFSMEMADREYYDGDTIDMWPVMREQLLLAIPDYPACNEDCRGLCQVCGENLNEKECGCTNRQSDPRLRSLQKYYKLIKKTE